jgi:hypothetical protein
MVHRHGARYPTSGSETGEWAQKLIEFRENGTRFTGDLAFLNDWSYKLGEAELTARGRQELFDSGVLHFFNYGKLYDAASKIIVRTTTMVRMLQSAENFLNGFFGPAWTNNATLEVIIESEGFNNSLAGNKMCDHAANGNGATGDGAMDAWMAIYLANATERFRAQISGCLRAAWTVEDTYNAQTICSYETVALGYSPFCTLFTWDEWEGFGYMTDLKLYGSYGLGSPVGRSIGLGYVEELITRLEGHLPLDEPDGSIPIAFNATLDASTETFPLNQSVYFNFSHDDEMFSMLTALGLTQFGEFLPPTHPSPTRALVGSHIVPFAARFAIEIIRAPKPVRATRPRAGRIVPGNVYEETGDETVYVHMLINQRTLPLGQSIAACGRRDDGWCEMSTFIRAQRDNIDKANYEASCFGDYDLPAYGEHQRWCVSKEWDSLKLSVAFRIICLTLTYMGIDCSLLCESSPETQLVG